MIILSLLNEKMPLKFDKRVINKGIMDVLYFLQQRTNFIRNFYEISCQPFIERRKKIEDGVEPFVPPPNSENPEPAFLEEWLEAGTSLQLLGRTCVSMLSASLKLYFKTWDRQLGAPHKESAGGSSLGGFIGIYQTRFGPALGVQWASCPANLGVLEQVVLFRNQDQHPSSITTFTESHDKKTLAKYSEPFFVHREEFEFLIDPDSPGQFLMDPSLYVSRDALFTALREAEQLAMWLDPLLTQAKYRRSS
jgi:hypothetical protein